MKSLAVLIGLLAVGLVSGSTVHILDQNDESIASIVEQVCWHNSGTSKQISKISTVEQIAEHLGSLPPNDKLAACSKLYLESVRDLAASVSNSNHNVCSQDKISAIQHFHRRYILKSPMRTGKAPKILATFFFHYVNSVAHICATQTAALLNTLADTPETNAVEVDNLMASLTAKTGVSSSSKLQYSDVFLVWSMVDLLPLRNVKKMEKYLFEGEKRVVIAAKNKEALLKVQDMCRTETKPFYSNSLLSTIQLIDMGYYPPSSDILEQLNNNKQARRFYELTKICEALLPVRVVEQARDADSEAVFLSREEVAELGLEVGLSEAEVEVHSCTHCAMSDDSLGSVTPAEAVSVAKRVKSNLKNRKGALSRLLKIFVKNAKANISGKLKRVFSGVVGDPIEELDENHLDIYQLSDDSDVRSVRSKRSVLEIFSVMVELIATVLNAILMLIWTIVTFFILIPSSLIVLLIGWAINEDFEPLSYYLLTGLGAFEPKWH